MYRSLSRAHSCAGSRVGSVLGHGGGGVWRNNQQGNHLELCSCAAWLAPGQLSPERVGSPLLLHSLLPSPSLSQPHIRTLSKLSKATGEKRERPNEARATPALTFKTRRQGTSKDARGFGFTGGSLGDARKVFSLSLRRKFVGGRAFFFPSSSSSSLWDVKLLGSRNRRSSRLDVPGSWWRAVKGCQDALCDPGPSAGAVAERPQASVVHGARLGPGALQGGHRSSGLQADLPQGTVSGYVRAG